MYKSYTVPHAGGWGNSNEDGAPVPEPGPFAKETSWPEVERDPHLPLTLYLAHISRMIPLYLACISPASPQVERDHAAVILYLDGLVGQLVGRYREIYGDVGEI